jgi:hypothetical protein
MMNWGMKWRLFSALVHIATDYRCASQHEILHSEANARPPGGLNFGKVGF